MSTRCPNPCLAFLLPVVGFFLAAGAAHAFAICGDSICQTTAIPAESCSTCPQDCGPCPPVCGNYVCEYSETPEECPTDCPSGVYSPADNHCVVNVTSRVQGLAARSGTVERYHRDSGTAGVTVTNEHGWPGTYPKTFGQLWNELDDRDLSKCHVQGIAKFPAGAPVDFTFGWNRVGGVVSPWLEVLLGAYCPEVDTPGAPDYPGTLMTKPASASRVRYAKYFGNLTTQNHPGGMQAIGKYLVVGIDAGGSTAQIYVWDFGDAQNPWVVRSFEHQGTTAAAVAIGRLAGGRYLLFIAADSGRTLSVYRSGGTNLSTTGWQYLGRFEAGVNWAGPSSADYNYNNLAIIEECGTNDLYLAGLTNDHYPDCGGNKDSCDTSVVDLHRITTNGNVVGSYGLQRLFDVMLDNPCDCFLCTDICPNFAAGGTLQPRPDGGLDAFATEHWNDGNDLDILEW